MKALLYHKEAPKENTVFAHMLSEEGKIFYAKFPHVLKSRRREIYHLEPGTIWDLNFKNHAKEIIVPKEAQVYLSPYNENPTYEELCLLKEMLEPLKIFPRGVEIPKIFKSFYQALLKWPFVNFTEKNVLASRLYLDLLEEVGYYYPEWRCFSCKKEITIPQAFVIAEGFLCQSCTPKKPLKSEERSLALWIFSLHKGKDIDIKEQQKIRRYLLMLLKEKYISP